MAERAQAWCQRCGKSLCGKSVWPNLDPWDSVRSTHSLHALERSSESMDRTVSSSLFLLKKEPTVLSELVEFGPCFSAETVKARALIGLHMMGEENALWLGSDFCSDFGDMWRNGCPESPEWNSSGQTSEAYCGFEFCGHIVENMAVEVIGQDRSSNVVALFFRVGCEGSRLLSRDGSGSQRDWCRLWAAGAV